MKNEHIIPRILEQLNLGHSICTDSRLAAKGDIFLALQGEQFDGNHFAQKAIEAGCQLAIIDDENFRYDDRYLLTCNVLELLHELGRAHRKKFHTPVLGITGSNGKTTTKELTHAVLSSVFSIHATRGNLNNHIGVPLTILSWRPPLDICIVEMGANHVGEIKQLCSIAKPGYGLITNIGKAHLEGFGSVENIARAKSELYEHVRQGAGTLFVNYDSHILHKLSQGAKVVTYGQSDDCHCQGRITSTSPFVHVKFWVNKRFGKAKAGIKGLVESRLTGAYNMENILAAITIGLYFGVAPEKVAAAISAYEPLNHRSQIINTGKNVVLMDAYNANPTSMVAALHNFSEFNVRKKAVMLGDMLELGSYASEEHLKIVEQTERMQLDVRMFVGDAFSAVCQPDNQTQVFKDVEQAKLWIKDNPLDDFHILIKGSRGIQMEKLLTHL